MAPTEQKTSTLKVGDKIPAFKVKDFEGEDVTNEDMVGSPFVLYFYPKDDTSGCTTQACEFRDLMDGFDDLDVLVVGVSPDSPESHKKFMEKNELNFPLLCDQKLEMAKAFGVTKDGTSVTRSTFFCDEDGVIVWIETPVTPEGHAERVISVIEELME